MVIEFNGVRGKSYKSALMEYPDVWDEDLKVMYEYLRPQNGESIVEIGAGSGFYSERISDAIGNSGVLYVVEPSIEQLLPIIRNESLDNIAYHCVLAEDFELPEGCFVDKIWTRGAFHHVKNKQKVLSNLAKSATQSTKLYIFDIFSNSKVADFFDTYVALACTTGHEVHFLSKLYASSMCQVTGWKKPKFVDIPLRWKFETENDIGRFLTMMLSLKPEFTNNDTLQIAKEVLGYEKVDNLYYLNWPMTLMITERDL